MITYLALGSNMGERLELLKAAREKLAADSQIEVLASSKLYETDPYGYTQQENFLNAVIKIDTSYQPADLLKKIHHIEAALDRKRLVHWGPRTIDIDILLMGDLNITTEELTIPHKEMTKRSFVLIPLRDVYHGELFNKSLAAWIEASGNQQEVRLAKEVW
ncbi:2-amino-4-hydroxy-6-hydroxymethyldihydropteridine diphosphokinase [Enterococcus sp. HY326]|uniref:2-amino-4-hydroxy-6- hydroxymethyldihydropteridine diphosphokinase n=1 Tax=Enterococcus sp. HY326 TaxID=2971265 RepID=UPI002240AEDD|nr:2-amino-4-hydroxy-6-hydroxymethyldihydropteridine diphosphokinase [Enterococcus sp. HY326]